MHKVLLVEDDDAMQTMWQDMLHSLLDGKEDEIILINAFSVQEAERKFFGEEGITAVVVDACVDGNKPDTPPLVEKIRSIFTGPIIAVSNDPYYQTLLMVAGCSHQCNKLDLPDKLIEIIGI